MKKHNLTPNQGLSMSQAQSISNMCYQEAKEIDSIISNFNNFSKTIKIGNIDKVLLKARKIPSDIVTLLERKSTLHACQSFLMENIKMKELLLQQAMTSEPTLNIEYPQEPMYKVPVIIPQVDENFGWSQLTSSEYNEYLESVSYASHIGQFIHKGCPLDKLRIELPSIPSIEFMELETGKKTPIDIVPHHTSEELLEIYEKLANLHREHEQKVNYYKSKVKNIVTDENTRIAKLNADAQNDANCINKKLMLEYEVSRNLINDQVKKLTTEFEIGKQKSIKEISSMRISVDPRFKDTIDKFMNKVTSVDNK